MTRRAAITIFTLLASTSPAFAHKLELSYRFLPGWRVQVTGWYEGGDPASGARVKVTQSNGQPLAEGRLNRNGVLIFTFSEAKELTIAISITGHRAERTVPAEAFAQQIACACAACLTPEPSPFVTASVLVPLPMIRDEAAAGLVPAVYDSGFPIWSVVGGAGILLAIAVVFKWLSSRRARA